MLRIVISDGSVERWILQGRLPRKCVVDLTRVTRIDECGEDLLKTMKKAGAEFVACGFNVKHVVGQCGCK